MISGATAVAPKSSSIDPKLLQEAADFITTLNATHAAHAVTAGTPTYFHYVMEFVTNRDCPQVDVSAIPEGILLVSRDNWEEAMGPVFGTRNLKHHFDVQQVALEQQQRLQTSGGFLFPAPRPSTDDFKEVTCTCSGDCTATAACSCVLSKKPCNSSCHLHGGLPPSALPSHDQCRNPLNAAIPMSTPLQQAHRGQSGCRCATGCASTRCSCRKANMACTTACHGLSGHDNCTNRTSAPTTSTTIATDAAATKKRGAASGKKERGGSRKRLKGISVGATAPVDGDTDDDEDT
jgi:hypothetical protein